MSDNEMLEELKQIRKLLEPKAEPPKPVGMWAEFLDFITKYKVMGLAVAFVLGLYLGELVKALVNGFVMPLVGLAVPGGAWETATVWVFQPGIFISALITFIIVCLVIFLMVKVTKRWGIE